MIRSFIIGAMLMATSARVDLWRDPSLLWADSASKSPSKARPHLALALTLLASGRPAESAEVSADGAQRFWPEASNFAQIEGQALLDLGRTKEAAERFEWGARRKPTAQSWSNAGSARYRLALMGLEPVEPAIADYRKSLAIETTGAALDGLADLLFYSGQWKALAARGMDPSSKDSLYVAGKWALLAGDYQQASDLLRQDWPLAQFNRGMAFYAMGKPEEAIEPYRNALRLAPLFNQARFNLGLALFHAEHRAEAVIELQRSGLLDPRNPVHAPLWRAVQEVNSHAS